MRKPQILAMIVIITIGVAAFNLRKPKTTAASRGKVIADKKSSLFDLKLNKASVLDLDVLADSTDVITGSVCLVDDEGKSLGGDDIRMVPRRFPTWFVFGCTPNGTIVDVDIRTLGNGQRQAIVRFTNSQRQGNR